MKWSNHDKKVIAFIFLLGFSTCFLGIKVIQGLFPSPCEQRADSLQLENDSLGLRHGYDSITIIGYKTSDTLLRAKIVELYAKTCGVVFEKKVKKK